MTDFLQTFGAYALQKGEAWRTGEGAELMDAYQAECEKQNANPDKLRRFYASRMGVYENDHGDYVRFKDIKDRLLPLQTIANDTIHVQVSACAGLGRYRIVTEIERTLRCRGAEVTRPIAPEMVEEQATDLLEFWATRPKVVIEEKQLPRSRNETT